ncbi:MAG: lipopolysaccharide heptosyltransferase II [Candidatus Omnitrophota bacterium]|nr:lipopolysaccharide heptosyltransferase II [Candidatus Omnitrophota bacterium]
MRRILIINVNWIGDVLFSTPFIRAIRETYPDSYIACLLHPRCKEMLEDNPRLNEIIIYDEEGAHKGLFGKLKLIAGLRNSNFDTAFILHRSFTKALIAKLAGAKEIVGYPTRKRAFLLTSAVEEPAEEIHKVEYFLNIARSAGIKPGSVSYEFFIKDSDRKFAEKLLRTNGVNEKDRFVVLCPGGNWDPKRWPKENFAKLADELADNFGVKIVISGAPKEMKLAEGIRNLMRYAPVIICGHTTLKQLAAIFEKSTLVIANDTGTMHMALAMKANTIALFGPTSPKITGPYGEGSYKVIFKNESCDVPCYDVTCKDNQCMAAIKVDDVVGEAKEALGR